MSLTMLAALAIAAALAATNAPAASAMSVADAVATNAVPPRMVTTWNQAQRELKRTAAQQADGAIDAAAAARRRDAVERAFVRVCRAKGIPEETIRHWQGKLKDEMVKW